MRGVQSAWAQMWKDIMPIPEDYENNLATIGRDVDENPY